MQVAKALLDTAAKQSRKPQAPSLQGASFADPSTLTALLRFQEVSRHPGIVILKRLQHLCWALEEFATLWSRLALHNCAPAVHRGRRWSYPLLSKHSRRWKVSLIFRSNVPACRA